MKREFSLPPENPGIPLPYPGAPLLRVLPPLPRQAAGFGQFRPCPQRPASAAPLGGYLRPAWHFAALCSVLSLCDPMDCNPPGSFVQERIPEWFAFQDGESPGWGWGWGGDLLTQRSSPRLLCLLHCRRILCLLSQHFPKTLQHGLSTNWLKEESAYYR